MTTQRAHSRYSMATAMARTDARSQNGIEADLKRIEEIILNARTTWFALIGALVFASVTLAGVEDVAFFMSDVKTELPLAGVSVPISSFFWAGSLLLTGVYIYFHLYLEQFWGALGELPSRIHGKPAAASVHPWIVGDAAFYVKDRLQGKSGAECSSRASSNGLRQYYIDSPEAIHCSVAAARDGTILGYQSLKSAGPGDPYGTADGWAVIGTFVVLDLGRLGIGSGLFEFTKIAATQSGVSMIDATIRNDNLPGLNYYEKMGFRTYRIEDGLVQMSYALADNGNHRSNR